MLMQTLLAAFVAWVLGYLAGTRRALGHVEDSIEYLGGFYTKDAVYRAKLDYRIGEEVEDSALGGVFQAYEAPEPVREMDPR
jgi:hypothetical protein